MSSKVLGDITNKTINEELLQENEGRFVIFPIQYSDIWSAYKETFTIFWTKDMISIDFNEIESFDSKLKDSFGKLISYWCKYNEQHILQKISNEIQVTEARFFLGFHVAMQINQMEIFGDAVRRINYNFIEDKKISSVNKWVETCNFPSEILIYICMNSIFISSFYVIRNILRSKGFDSMSKVFDLFIKDKKGYMDFGQVLFKHIKYNLSKTEVHEIVGKAVNLEKDFLKEVFDDPILTNEVVEARANEVCVLCKVAPLF